MTSKQNQIIEKAKARGLNVRMARTQLWIDMDGFVISIAAKGNQHILDILPRGLGTIAPTTWKEINRQIENAGA
jgi:hypothetical protein